MTLWQMIKAARAKPMNLSTDLTEAVVLVAIALVMVGMLIGSVVLT